MSRCDPDLWPPDLERLSRMSRDQSGVGQSSESAELSDVMYIWAKSNNHQLSYW